MFSNLKKKKKTKNNKKHVTIYFFDKDKTTRVNPLLDWLAVAPPTYRHLCIPEVEKKKSGSSGGPKNKGGTVFIYFTFLNILWSGFSTDYLSLIITSIASHECERRRTFRGVFAVKGCQ